MPRPTSTGPAFVFVRTDIAMRVIGAIASVIGPLGIEGVDRVERRINVWPLVGESGFVLVAESSATLDDRPGVT